MRRSLVYLGVLTAILATLVGGWVLVEVVWQTNSLSKGMALTATAAFILLVPIVAVGWAIDATMTFAAKRARSYKQGSVANG